MLRLVGSGMQGRRITLSSQGHRIMISMYRGQGVIVVKKERICFECGEKGHVLLSVESVENFVAVN